MIGMSLFGCVVVCFVGLLEVPICSIPPLSNFSVTGYIYSTDDDRTIYPPFIPSRTVASHITGFVWIVRIAVFILHVLSNHVIALPLADWADRLWGRDEAPSDTKALKFLIGQIIDSLSS